MSALIKTLKIIYGAPARSSILTANTEAFLTTALHAAKFLEQEDLEEERHLEGGVLLKGRYQGGVGAYVK